MRMRSSVQFSVVPLWPAGCTNTLLFWPPVKQRRSLAGGSRWAQQSHVRMQSRLTQAGRTQLLHTIIMGAPAEHTVADWLIPDVTGIPKEPD